MQKIYFTVVGKIKESFYREAVAEYVKRLSRFAKIEIKELPEGANPEAEAEEILRNCKGYVIALAVEGEKLSSEKLAEKLQKITDAGKDITFVIGSSCGLSNRVKQAADYDLPASAYAGDFSRTGLPRVYDQRGLYVSQITAFCV